MRVIPCTTVNGVREWQFEHDSITYEVAEEKRGRKLVRNFYSIVRESDRYNGPYRVTDEWLHWLHEQDITLEELA